MGGTSLPEFNAALAAAFASIESDNSLRLFVSVDKYTKSSKFSVDVGTSKLPQSTNFNTFLSRVSLSSTSIPSTSLKSK